MKVRVDLFISLLKFRISLHKTFLLPHLSCMISLRLVFTCIILMVLPVTRPQYGLVTDWTAFTAAQQKLYSS